MGVYECEAVQVDQLVPHVHGRARSTFVDKFLEVRQLIKAWNTHMANVFLVGWGWVICLDESMSIWHQRWMCLGWVFCPRKPHPFGNENHTAWCALTYILFSIELVKGTDSPPQVVRDFDAHGKIGGLLLRMLWSYHHTGRYMVLDSGLCVLKAITDLQKVGLQLRLKVDQFSNKL